MEEPKLFKEKFSFEQRLAESQKISTKYKSSVPVIVEPKDRRMQKIDKTKFLVPYDLTYGQFLYIVRKRLKIDSTESIYLFCKGSLSRSTDTIQHIHQTMGDADGFLYFVYAFENTFG